MRSLTKIALLPLLCAAILAPRRATGQRSSEGPARLLIPGSPYDGDAAAVSRQQWFGVYRVRGSRQEVRRAAVRIVRGENGCFDTKVMTADSVPPLFLVGGVQTLHPGPVDTVFNGHRFLYPGESVSWQLSSGWFVLRAAGTATPHSTGTSYTNYELQLGSTLDRYATSQVLAHLNFGDNTPTIRWAGDIDGDGRLDLLVELSGEGYSDILTLFLSSSARGADHVGEVGRLYLMDC